MMCAYELQKRGHMKLTKAITIRLTEEEREFLDKEKERTKRVTGFNISVGDIVRNCINVCRLHRENDEKERLEKHKATKP